MSEYPFNLADIVSYFDSVKSCYPSGLPEECIVEAQESVAEISRKGFGSGKSGVCFLGALQESEEAWKLLQAAISKGMKLSTDTVYFIESSHLSADRSALEAELCAQGVQCLLVLGDVPWMNSQKGSWSHLGKIKVLGSLSLVAVLSDSAKKKEFWGHLQMIMKELQK